MGSDISVDVLTSGGEVMVGSGGTISESIGTMGQDFVTDLGDLGLGFCIYECGLDSDCMVNQMDLGYVCFEGVCIFFDQIDCTDDSCWLLYSGW